MAYPDEIAPVEDNEQNSQLAHDLRSLYDTPTEIEQSLARMRTQLLIRSTSIANTRQRMVTPQRQQPGRVDSEPSRMFTRKTWQRRLNFIAAIALVALLVGSFIVVLDYAHQSGTGTPKGTQIPCSSASTGNYGFNPYWKVLAHFSCTGNVTIDKLNLKLTAFWAYKVTCNDGGKQTPFTLGLNLENSEVSLTDEGYCNSSGSLYLADNTTIQTIHTLKTVTSPQLSWQLTIAVCKDPIVAVGLYCGKTWQTT
jgi:hypothetical protein